MSRASIEGRQALANAIKQQSRSATVRQYARAHPFFRVTTHLPDYFAEMLARLEREEARQQKR
jgi:hypothetical protein